MQYDPLLTLPDWCFSPPDDWLELPGEVSDVVNFALRARPDDYQSEVQYLKGLGRDPVTQLGQLASERYRYHLAFWAKDHNFISGMAAELQVMHMRANAISIVLEGVKYCILEATPNGKTLKLTDYSVSRTSKIYFLPSSG